MSSAPDQADPAPPTTPAALPVRRRRWPWLLSPLLLLALLAGVAAWLLTSTAGLSSLAQWAESLSAGRLRIVGTQGRLWGPLHIRELHYTDADRRLTLSNLTLDWQASALADGRLQVSQLSADSLDLANRDNGKAPTLPTDLQLPLALQIQHLSIARLRLLPFTASADGQAQPSLELGALSASLGSDGRHHHLSDLQLASPWGALSGRLQLDGQAPFPLSADAQLKGESRDYLIQARAAGPLAGFTLHADAQGLNLTGSAEVDATPFAAIPLSRLQIQGGAVDPAAFAAGLPHAALSLSADLRPGADANLQHLHLSGPIQISNRLPGPANQGALPFSQGAAQVDWQNAKLTLNDLLIQLSGQGRVGGSAVWQNGQLTAQLSLQQVNLAPLASGLQTTRIDGELTLSASQARQALQAKLREARFTAQLDAEHNGERIAVRRLQLAAGAAGQIDLSGWLEWQGARRFNAQGRFERFDPGLLFTLPGPARGNSRIGARFTSQGQWAPRLQAQLDFQLDGSSLAGRPLLGHGRLALSPERISQVDLSLDLAGNLLNAQGSFGAAGDQLQLTLDARQPGRLWPAGGVDGSLQGQASLAGSFAQPWGKLSVNAENLRLPGGHGVGHLSLTAALGAGRDASANAQLEFSHLQLAGQALAQQGRLTLTGSRSHHHLEAQASLTNQGEFSLQASGSLAPQQLAWSGSLEKLALSGPSPWAFSLSQAAPLTLAAERISLGAAEIQLGQGRIKLASTSWTPQEVASRGELSGLLVGSPPRRPRSGSSRSTDTRLRLGAVWDLHLDKFLRGDLRLFRESGDLLIIGDAPARLGLDKAELILHADQGKLAGSLEVHGSRLGTLGGAGTSYLERDPVGPWPLRLTPHTPLVLAVALDMPSMEWLGPVLDPNLQTSGSLKASFNINGNADQPRGQGHIEGEQLTLALADQGLRLAGGSLRLDFDQDKLTLNKLEFNSPNRTQPRETRLNQDGKLTALGNLGKLSASGQLRIADGRGEFRFNVDRLPVMQRPDRWLMLSGQATLATTWEALALSGKLTADGGYWELAGKEQARLSDDVIVRGQQTRSAQPLKFDLDLEADLGSRFYLKGYGVDTRLEGAVRLRSEGKTSALRASGLIKTVGGAYDAYGQSLSVEQGLISFQGPLDNPGLNIVAMRKNQPVEAGVAITGTALRPRVKLVSEPEVPDAEKLSWIVLGRAPDQVGGSESALLLSAATALLGEPGTGSLSRQLARNLGLDDISVGSGDLGGQAVRTPTSTVAGGSTAVNSSTTTQIVSLGKRLSASAYLSYEQSLSGAGNVVKLTYNLSKNLSLVGRAGTDNTLDLLYTFSFR